MDKKKYSIIFVAVLALYVACLSIGDEILEKTDSAVFEMSLSIVKNHYLLYNYASEEKDSKNRLDLPISLALKYGDEYGIETMPEPDHVDYETTETEQTSMSAEEEKSDAVVSEETVSSVDRDITQEESETQAQSVSGAMQTISPDILTYEYLMKNIYTVAGSTVLYESDINGAEFMSRDMKMKQDNSKPQILVYHTHGQEGFVDSVEGNPQTKIIGVGEYLVSILREKYGYNVIHVTDSFDLVNGVFDRSKAYDYAYDKISQVLADNPSIEVVIDLHRDGVNENLHLVTDINGKQTAQIMFFNGMSRLASTGEIDYLYNPNRSDNLAFSLQLKIKAMEYYPGFTRRNYIQAYEYNQQVRPKSLLIEAGAQTNYLQEEKNAMEPLADILHRVLSE